MLGFLRYLISKRGKRWGKDEPWIKVIWCRMRNHPCGVVWYNGSGLEPDMTCKNCGDDLG